MMVIDDDAQLATTIARDAGEHLLGLRLSSDAAPRELKDLGDAASQRLISRLLAKARPDDVMLSEEAEDDVRRLDRDRVWIIDPLDGTREFGERRGDWAVHVALWRRDAPLLGAISIPAEALVMSSELPPNLPPRKPGPIRIAASRTRPPQIVLDVARAMGAELVPMGSAGYKIAAVVRGEVDAYVHAGGQFQWDSAAPVAVATAAGLHASRLDGLPLRYNGRSTSLPDLVVARPEVAVGLLEQISGLLAGAGGDGGTAS